MKTFIVAVKDAQISCKSQQDSKLRVYESTIHETGTESLKHRKQRMKRNTLSILRQASVIYNCSPNTNVSESKKGKKKKKAKERSNCHVNSF